MQKTNGDKKRKVVPDGAKERESESGSKTAERRKKKRACAFGAYFGSEKRMAHGVGVHEKHGKKCLSAVKNT